MLFMNEYEIDECAQRHSEHPVLGRATRFLARYRDEVNRNSDGWPYWAPPVKAAAKLMTLIQNAEREGKQPTEADLKSALAPIKSFYTRRGSAAGMRWPFSDGRWQ